MSRWGNTELPDCVPMAMASGLRHQRRKSTDGAREPAGFMSIMSLIAALEHSSDIFALRRGTDHPTNERLATRASLIDSERSTSSRASVDYVANRGIGALQRHFCTSRGPDQPRNERLATPASLIDSEPVAQPAVHPTNRRLARLPSPPRRSLVPARHITAQNRLFTLSAGYSKRIGGSRPPNTVSIT